MLHERCPPQSLPQSIPQSIPDLTINRQTMRMRMLHKLQRQASPSVSDIDQYFDSPRVAITGTEGPDWLYNWWRTHRGEYHQMAREFLAIPASEVSVERLFSAGRDLLGIRRLRLGADTMRILMLMKDVV